MVVRTTLVVVPPRHRVARVAAATLAALLFTSFLVSPDSGTPSTSASTDASSLDWQHLLIRAGGSSAAGTSADEEAGNGGTVRSSQAPPSGPSSHSSELSGSPDATRSIPRRLIFTYKHNILKTGRPRKAYANVMATIDAYRTAWNVTAGNQTVDVWFLDDNACREVVAQTEPRLLVHFNRERFGSFKADVCRAAAMTLRGGYYFDVDVEVVRPYVVPDGVTFCAPTSQANTDTLFQAFWAAMPNHPVVVKSLEFMLRHYDQSDDFHCYLLGPRCLHVAYTNVTGDLATLGKTRHSPEYKFLHEFRLDAEGVLFPDVPRQNGGGAYCNYGVQDPETRQFHFYSRFVGSSASCWRVKCDDYGCSKVAFQNDDVRPPPPKS